VRGDPTREITDLWKVLDVYQAGRRIERGVAWCRPGPSGRLRPPMPRPSRAWSASPLPPSRARPIRLPAPCRRRRIRSVRIFAAHGFKETTLHHHEGFTEPTWVTMEREFSSPPEGERALFELNRSPRAMRRGL